MSVMIGVDQHVDDLRRVDEQLKASGRRITLAVAASGTSLVELFGVGPALTAGPGMDTQGRLTACVTGISP